MDTASADGRGDNTVGSTSVGLGVKRELWPQNDPQRILDGGIDVMVVRFMASIEDK